ncbi:MAG: flagellin [Rhodospirillales bacterium]|nr:flagellin [Rhodospirillales bacterium]MDH3791070.1 flagellin [Rhodospirillales bacterium]MDH3910645.1 flagellin [Rhodospirillales bacterium]MDH3918203.1 flagellin [Rhodospirillales bacterium]MDH3965554.1 flagellin [Rhodospirillales bacterium]
MANDISLSAAVRENLLALANTERLISRTQNRLSTGLRVASPVDDARVFFEAKAISDHARDMDERKEGIDQAVSSVTTALEAIEAIDALVQQLKGLLISAKSSSGNELTLLETQFNDLRAQIDNLATDASYQGLNLINATGSALEVFFSSDSNSVLNIDSVDVTTGSLGLAINSVANLSLSTLIDAALAEIATATDTLRGNAQSLGSNIALLQTRLDFTENYVNVLAGGAGKLNLADITEEGANLVALQTRQQLGVSALAFAGQSEQSVLQLFR